MIGYGIHNLWTYLFVPFNLAMYKDDSLFLRNKENEIFSESNSRGEQTIKNAVNEE
jgi:hypothetical protein